MRKATTIEAINGNNNESYITPHTLSQTLQKKTTSSSSSNIVTGAPPVKAGYKIDGKDVWVKHVNLGNLPNSAYKDISTGLSNITVISNNAVCMRSSDGLVLVLPYATGDTSIALQVREFGKVVRIITTNDVSAYVGKILIYFTYN